MALLFNLEQPATILWTNSNSVQSEVDWSLNVAAEEETDRYGCFHVEQEFLVGHIDTLHVHGAEGRVERVII